jgi:hypothetical protein
MEKSGFVDGDDLVKLCRGLVQGAAQMEFLKNMGLKAFPGEGGHPVVTWEAVHRVQAQQQIAGARPAPNFGALRSVK